MSNKMDESSTSAPKKLIQRQIHPIIEIVNGTKNYGYWGNYKQVLREFDMTIYSGEVYALLGPHGCGKSTVLNVILGITKLNEGQVKIFGFKPGCKPSGVPGIRVGYTPQASGLYSEFTINETLRYYGALLRLKKQYVSTRIAFLSNLLALPNDNQIISQCSEGNKRQISFAVALLHEPEVLILDEPFAGIDPVLRRNMWEHMKTLSQEDKAIVITTQSCEEAGWANKIGFMRNGSLSIVGDPKELLSIYKEKYIETLYRRVYSFNLGKLKTSASVEQNPIIILEPIVVTSSEGFLYSGEEISTSNVMHSGSVSLHSNTRGSQIINIASYGINLQRLCVSIIRDFKRCYRSYVRLILYILLPSIFLTIFCITVGTTPSSLCLGVVNAEVSQPFSCAEDSEEFLSCQFLDVIDNHIIKQKQFSNVNDAQDAARNLEILGILVISQDFTEYIHQALSEVLLGRSEHGVTVPITLSLDFTSKIVAFQIESTVREAADTFIRLATANTPVEDTGVAQLITLGSPLFGSKSNMDTYYMAPGLILTFIFHMAAFWTSNTLITDRIMKLTLRNYLAGVQLEETIISQMIVCGIITLIQASLLLMVLLLIFDVPNKGSLWYIFLIAFVQIWCGLSFGILVSMISKSAIETSICVFCFGVMTLFLCGVQWPLNGLPDAFKIPIKFLPQTAAIEAVRTIIHRGTSIVHSRVWYGIVVPFCWSLMFKIAYVFKNKVI